MREYPGLTDFDFIPSAPQLNEKGDSARVAVGAKWKLYVKEMKFVRDIERDGDRVTFDSRFTIRVNRSMGADAIVGKAERKAYKAILGVISSGRFDVPDGDVLDTTGTVVTEPTAPLAPPEQDGKRMSIGKRANGQEQTRMREPGED